MTTALTLAVGVLVALLILIAVRQTAVLREGYMRGYAFPQGLFDQVRKRHPDLSLKDCQLVAPGAPPVLPRPSQKRPQVRFMPSQVADDLWHEFILYTKHYEVFCRKAFGRFLHHTPAS